MLYRHTHTPIKLHAIITLHIYRHTQTTIAAARGVTCIADCCDIWPRTRTSDIVCDIAMDIALRRQAGPYPCTSV